MNINQGRLTNELEMLASFTAGGEEANAGETAVTRVVFTPQDLAARAWLTDRAHEAGLAVSVDAVGNTFYRWEGTEPGLPAVATGSHIDAIPNAGMYDGTVGVLGGLEAIRALQAAGYKPRRAIELVLFTSEEPTRFAIGCLGSRMMSGALAPDAAAALRDGDGRGLGEVRQHAGFAGELASVRVKRGSYAAFLELHIEQGPMLEQQGLPIGVVTAIAAPASLRITVQGEGGHAGAMLMPVRRDALVAAAELICGVERAVLATGAMDTVGTVGVCEVFPGAVNSVPSRVRLGLDVRDTDEARRDGVLRTIDEVCRKVAALRKVAVTTEIVNADSPVACDVGIVDAILEACVAQQLPSLRMVSRAYHDTLFMARICPVGMIFIPCRKGVSHRPDEFAEPTAIAAGVRILAGTLQSLSR